MCLRLFRYPWVQRRFGPLAVCRSGLLAAMPLSLCIPACSYAAASKLVRSLSRCYGVTIRNSSS